MQYFILTVLLPGGMTTGPDCVESCVGRPAGRYMSCHGCDIYVLCKDGGFMRDRIPCETLDGQDTYFDPITSTCSVEQSPLCTPVTRVDDRNAGKYFMQQSGKY